MTNPLLIFRHNDMRLHLQDIMHLDHPSRLEALQDALDHESLAGKWTDVTARHATIEELAWVHTAEHIAKIAATAGKNPTSQDSDTMTTKDSYAAACLAVGGLFSLIDAIMTTPSGRGFAALRPPGHHAEPDRAMGFCLFNNTALGACYLKHRWGLSKVMIVDIDAHHGNGTQKVFFHTHEVLYLSMHQFPLFPGSGNFTEIGHGPGEGYSVNVPLDRGMGDREFVEVIDRLAYPLARAFAPQAILVSCGFDLYQGECLAQLKGTAEGYGMLARLLCDLADQVCAGRIAFIMEGGYHLQGIHDCGLKVLQEMCGLPTVKTSRLKKFSATTAPPFAALGKAMTIHKAYWPTLRG